MSTAHWNPSEESKIDDRRLTELRIGVVTAEWNRAITGALLQGCVKTLIDNGISEDHIYQVLVPGSFELPAGARMVDDHHSPDAIICLGCVIQGATRHNEYINTAVAHGLMQLSIVRGKPFIFGVLTPDDEAQALERAGGVLGNKGVEAALAALRMSLLKLDLKPSKKTIGF